MTIEIILTFITVLSGLFFAMSGRKRLILMTALVYTAGLLYVTLVSRLSTGTFSSAFTGYQIAAYGEAAGFVLNVLLFVPFGYLSANAMKGRHSRVLLPAAFGFLFSFSIECEQHFSGLGVFDPVDLIANTTGALTGALLCILILESRRTSDPVRLYCAV